MQSVRVEFRITYPPAPPLPVAMMLSCLYREENHTSYFSVFCDSTQQALSLQQALT